MKLFSRSRSRRRPTCAGSDPTPTTPRRRPRRPRWEPVGGSAGRPVDHGGKFRRLGLGNILDRWGVRVGWYAPPLPPHPDRPRTQHQRPSEPDTGRPLRLADPPEGDHPRGDRGGEPGTERHHSPPAVVGETGEQDTPNNQHKHGSTGRVRYARAQRRTRQRASRARAGQAATRYPRCSSAGVRRGSGVARPAAGAPTTAPSATLSS